MNMKHIIILLVALTCSFLQVKADDIPTIDPQATFITSEGEETGTSYQGSAPLTVRFAANAENVGGMERALRMEIHEGGKRLALPCQI